LIGVNPLEQLARARDASRISAVSQLGRAIDRYAVNQEGTYPAASTTWQDTLVSAGEIKGVVSAPANSFACSAVNNQGNICYAVGTSSYCPGTNTSIWTILESKLYSNKIGCSSGQYPYAIYQSFTGKIGYICGGTYDGGVDICYPLVDL